MLALLLYLCQSSSSYSRSITAKAEVRLALFTQLPAFPAKLTAPAKLAVLK